MKNRLIPIVTLVIICVFAIPAAAQEVLLDEFEKLEGLTLFKSFSNPLEYYYLPDNPHVSIKPDGKPDFSFMKYVTNRANSGSGGITDAEGGAVLHMLVSYDVDQKIIKKAEKALQNLYEDSRIVGPLHFRSGTFSLVSTILDEKGGKARKVIGTGKAPLIEGMKAAVSIDLTPEGASLLAESLKMATPDISLLFDMEMSGFRNPFEATLEVDWDQVYKDQSFGVGVDVYFVGIDVDFSYERLRQDGAITLNVKGESSSMEPIIQRAHSMLLDMMFKPVEPPEEETLLENQGSMANMISSGSGGSSAMSSIKISGYYKLKDVKRSGKGQFDFNHHSSDSLNIVMAANIGNIFQRFGDDPTIFKAVNLDDPVFRQREIYVTVDGQSEQDFTDYVNFVTVQIRKQHQNAETTLDEIVIDKNSYLQNNNRFSMVYGWKGDDDRQKWLEYEYRTVWNFKQGIQVDSKWQSTSTFVINVMPPYEYRRISLEADPQLFAERGVRHAHVKFFYTFFDKEIELQQTVRNRNNQAVSALEYVCQAGNYDYSYEITWYLRNRGRLQLPRTEDSSEIIYVDEFPQQ
jgi:hypothetical protein